jgi:type VI secretion system protein ImpF
MAELSQQERLQPSLLDRLRDDEPGKQMESRDRRVISPRKLRECVKRDLTWLLNTGNLEEVEDLSEAPLVAKSVLNYGLPELTGITSSGADVTAIERQLRQAILDFEPRILRNTLRVSVIAAEEMSHNALSFEIYCDVWADPVPERLYLKTEVDLESGDFSVTESVGA